MDQHNLPILLFKSAEAWEEWLGKHYGQTDGIWLKIAKKASGKRSVTYDEALEVALCYGWIDGLGKSLDDAYYLQKIYAAAGQEYVV